MPFFQMYHYSNTCPFSANAKAVIKYNNFNCFMQLTRYFHMQELI